MCNTSMTVSVRHPTDPDNSTRSEGRSSGGTKYRAELGVNRNQFCHLSVFTKYGNWAFSVETSRIFSFLWLSLCFSVDGQTQTLRGALARLNVTSLGVTISCTNRWDENIFLFITPLTLYISRFTKLLNLILVLDSSS